MTKPASIEGGSDVIVASADVDQPAAPGRGILRRTWRYRSARVGAIAAVALLVMAFLGPYVAPHGETEIVGLPYSGPSSDFLMGTDFLGRDVFSRFLHGGRALILLSVAATVIGMFAGTVIGVVAGYAHGAVDFVLMRVMDLLLAFPSIILILILVAALGNSVLLLVSAVSFMHVAKVSRVVRAATEEVSVQEFIEAAEARGERQHRMLFVEILPNITSPVVAEFGVRCVGSVLILASVSFLGLGLEPPQADWAVMIGENRGGIILQPYAVLYPAIAIATLAIAINLVGDGFARAAGRSTTEATVV